MNNYIWLSYPLYENTPSYGDKEKMKIIKTSSIANGDVANHTKIIMSCHLGTHIDTPYHFFDDGQTIEDFPAEFWVFEKIGFLEISPKGLIVKDEILDRLDEIDFNIEILLIKTGACYFRHEKRYMIENYGFHPDLADCFRNRFKKLRVFGFDSISVSSFTNRKIGREAHRKFLEPKNPILLLEDINLQNINNKTKIDKIYLGILMVLKSDGLLCSVLAIRK